MSDPYRFPSRHVIESRFGSNGSLSMVNLEDIQEFISVYSELRDAYIHVLNTNRALRSSVSALSRDHRELQSKYHSLCMDHDILADEHTSDL